MQRVDTSDRLEFFISRNPGNPGKNSNNIHAEQSYACTFIGPIQTKFTATSKLETRENKRNWI